MKRAVHGLEDSGSPPDYLLVDGKFPVPLNIPQDCLIKGESRSSSIAAASIAAKIYRDNLMEKLHKQYPLYNFKKNKGYPTREHRDALRLHGPCPAHRISFNGVILHD
jgi:ribonuclease HII